MPYWHQVNGITTQPQLRVEMSIASHHCQPTRVQSQRFNTRLLPLVLGYIYQWLVQNCSNSSALALELLKSYTNPSMWLLTLNKVWWLCLVPTSTTRFASDVGYRMPKFNTVIQGKYFLWTMTSNSLTENEEHGIPSQILKTIFGLHASVIF